MSSRKLPPVADLAIHEDHLPREEILKYANNNTIFIFDDIHWSEGMESAWEYIKAHEKTTLTIDLFFIGIVFIRSELSKENFIIRF